MIIQIGTDVDESRILWKYKESDEWKRADIDDLIRAYEKCNQLTTTDVVEVVRCGECKLRKKNGFCLEYMRYEKNDNGYCLYGKRREE